MMTQRVNYELRKDKRGRKYGVQINIKTGKQKRIAYKVAQKRKRDLKYSRKKAKVVEQLKREGTGATYKEYQKTTKKVEKEIVIRRKKQGKEPLNKSVLRGRAKKATIEDRTGIATRMRYAWVYRVVASKTLDTVTGEYLVECDSPCFVARALKRNGDEFTKMVGVCREMYNEIMAMDLCSIDGGACVLQYEKFDKEVIKKFELGKGCGFSFDFKNYQCDEEQVDNHDGYDWI